MNAAKRRPIIAVDFDGVIVEDRYPEIGPANQDVIQFLRHLAQLKWYIIIYTCRGGAKLAEAKAFLAAHEVPHNTVNDHAPGCRPEDWGNRPEDYGPCVKPGADIYLDDRGCRYDGSVRSALALVREIEARRSAA